MTTTGLDAVSLESNLPSLGATANYLQSTHWQMTDSDPRTTAWSAPESAEAKALVVLPAKSDFTDTAELIGEALRVLAWIEKRPIAEVIEDINTGGIDSVAVRLHPDAPNGQAPLGFINLVVPALRDFVAASASATLARNPMLVLPTRRPVQAENYADQVRLSSTQGSFVLTLSMPLVSEIHEDFKEDENQDSLTPPPQIPFGRLVQLRMSSSAERAIKLAEDVSAGRQRIQAFARPGKKAPNATEIASLGLLGGRDFSPYQIRFAQSPRWTSGNSPETLTVNPGLQRILLDAADFLRNKQPRSNVTVVGMVIKISRAETHGSGEIVIYGPDDDTGTQRRFRAHVSEQDYSDAVIAHRSGRMISVTGDVELRGMQRHLARISSFAVLPTVDGDDDLEFP